MAELLWLPRWWGTIQRLLETKFRLRLVSKISRTQPLFAVFSWAFKKGVFFMTVIHFLCFAFRLKSASFVKGVSVFGQERWWPAVLERVWTGETQLGFLNGGLPGKNARILSAHIMCLEDYVRAHVHRCLTHSYGTLGFHLYFPHIFLVCTH